MSDRIELVQVARPDGSLAWVLARPERPAPPTTPGQQEKTTMDIDHGVRRWLDAGKYLPPEFRDFHDQKDVFKALFCGVDIQGLSWIDAHIFTVDKLLWYLAAHGYTLQRSRKRLPFCDLNNSIRQRQRAEAIAFRAAFAAREEATKPTAN